tara:strand:+ start:4459 stop:12189 length:7731 start_codon:yes stop_codon:yes gene_type:complete
MSNYNLGNPYYTVAEYVAQRFNEWVSETAGFLYDSKHLDLDTPYDFSLLSDGEFNLGELFTMLSTTQDGTADIWNIDWTFAGGLFDYPTTLDFDTSTTADTLSLYASSMAIHGSHPYWDFISGEYPSPMSNPDPFTASWALPYTWHKFLIQVYNASRTVDNQWDSLSSESQRAVESGLTRAVYYLYLASNPYIASATNDPIWTLTYLLEFLVAWADITENTSSSSDQPANYPFLKYYNASAIEEACGVKESPFHDDMGLPNIFQAGTAGALTTYAEVNALTWIETGGLTEGIPFAEYPPPGDPRKGFLRIFNYMGGNATESPAFTDALSLWNDLEIEYPGLYNYLVEFTFEYGFSQPVTDTFAYDWGNVWDFLTDEDTPTSGYGHWYGSNSATNYFIDGSATGETQSLFALSFWRFYLLSPLWITDGFLSKLGGIDGLNKYSKYYLAESDPSLSADLESQSPYEESMVETESCKDDPAPAPVDCSSCVPDPAAFVPDWIMLPDDSVFKDASRCDYCAVITTDYETLENESGVFHDFSPYVEEGVSLLLERHMKSTTLSFTEISAGGTAITTTVNTIDVLMGRESAEQYLGQSIESPRIPEDYDGEELTRYGYRVATAPLINVKALVVIPATTFDLIPVDLDSSIREVTPLEGNSFVSLEGFKIKKMSHQVARSLRIYAKEYSYYVQNAQFEGESASNYGDLDLNKESDYIKQFSKDLLSDILKPFGLTYRRIEKLEIGFMGDDGSESWYPNKIEYFNVTPNGCMPLAIPKALWGPVVRVAPWANSRTLGYIHHLPDIHSDVVAREFPEWADIVDKYTTTVLDASAFAAAQPQSALECVLEDVVTDPLAAIAEDILKDILSFPDVVAHSFNKKLCTGGDYDRLDKDLEDLDGIFKRAREQALSNFFGGDVVFDMIEDYIKNYDEKTGDPVRDLWRYILDKWGWCGLLALIDMLLGCLLSGMPAADGLAMLVQFALRNLDPIQLEKLFIGLPADKQQEIAAAVAEAVGTVTATPPWEKEYKAGSYTMTPERKSSTVTSRSQDRGEALAPSVSTADGDGGIPVEDLEPKDAADYINYLGSLENPPVSPGTVEAAMKAQYPDIAFESPSYTGIGTIGGAADDVMDVIAAAYIDAIMDLVDIDTLVAALQSMEGAAFISSLLSSIKCAIPPLFDPPLDDFMKTLELDFCRPNYGITLPKWQGLKIPDIWAILVEVIKQALINLVVKFILTLIQWILNMLLNGFCKLLGLFGEMLEQAIGGDFRETFKTAFCDDETMGQITDEEIDIATAGMMAALAGCPPPSQPAATAFISDLSLVLTEAQLFDLVNGEASDESLQMIEEIVKYRHPEFSCSLTSPAKINDLFGSLGRLIPDEYKQKPMSADKPCMPSFCVDQTALDKFYEDQCVLMQQKGPLTEETCNKLLDAKKNRLKDALEPLAELINNQQLPMPELFADDPCNPGTWSAGLVPRNDPVVMGAAAAATKTSLNTIENRTRRDLIGRHGLLNMILAAKNGRGLQQHYNNLTNFPNLTKNKFPEQVAGHLKDKLESLESNLDFATDGTSVNRITHWGADKQREFFTIDRDTNGRVFPTTALGEGKFDSGWQEKYEGQLFVGGQPLAVGYNPEPIASFKRPDLTLNYADYKNDQPYKFEIQYHNFQLDSAGSAPLNDYYKILIKHEAEDKADAEDPKELEWYEGFEGEQLSEGEVRDMISEIESTSDSLVEGILDVDAQRASGLSPKNLLYGKMIRSSWDRYTADPTDTPSEPTIDADREDTISDTYYGSYDKVFSRFLGKYGKSIASSGDNRFFKHGMSTAYRGPLDPDQTFDPPAMDIDINDMSEEEIATELGIPIKIDLSGSYTDLTGESWQIPPEVYGGTDKRPGWYYQPPKYPGWMGIKQAIIPEDIYTGCDQPRTGMINFDDLAELINDLYERMPDDPRLQQKEGCTMEHPYNKALDRYSSAGIEGLIRATCRIHVLEAYLKSVQSLALYKFKSPEVYDSMFIDKIVDSIEAGILEQTQKRVFRSPQMYYLTFMEQVVQSFGKRVDLGDFEPTGIEQEAIDRLTGKAGEEANPLNQDHWEKNDWASISRAFYPDTVSAGISAAVGSAIAPGSGGVAGSIIASAKSRRIAKKRKKVLWKKYISDPSNLRDTKILLRRYVSEEIETFIKKTVGTRLEASVDDLHNEFLVNPAWIMGALGNDGPSDVGSYDETLGGISYSNVDAQMTLYRTLNSTGLADNYGFLTSEEHFWPFILEKYVKITESDFGTVVTKIPYWALSDADRDRLNRVHEPHLRGVVSLPDWQEWLSSNSDLFAEGTSISDYFGKWEYGLRICHVANDHMKVGDDVGASTENTFWSSFLSTAGYNIESLSMYNKAFQLLKPTTVTVEGEVIDNVGQPKYLFPLVDTRREVTDMVMTAVFAVEMDVLYASEFDCLVDDMVISAPYKMMFNYIFPLPRMLSMVTIYNMLAFLPSIGSADADDWETRVFGTDADAGGGKWFGSGKSGGFRTWDWNDLFRRAKRQAYRVFEAYYYASDFDWQPPEKDRSGKLNRKLNINISWNFLSFLRKMRIREPFNTDGQPCPLIEEED